VDRCFHQNHPLHTLFSRDTVKTSYSCMPSVNKIIQDSNRKKLNTPTDAPPATNNRMCNCRNAANCPLRGECLSSSVLYQAIVKANDTEESYVGLTANSFKSRFSGHKHSFNNRDKKHSTELSQHVWTLKDNNRDFNIEWKVLGSARSYSNVTKRCALCNLEKYYIICRPELASLNKRTEIVNKCRHQNKFLISSSGIT